jgi:phage/plasmid primase-like uncharacterized protein
MLSLKETLDHHKIAIVPDFSATKMQRSGPQWLRAYRFGIEVVYFGCYKSNVNEVWRGDTSHLTAEEIKELKKQEKKAHEEMAKAREEEQIRIKLEVQAKWPNFIDRGTTQYLDRKLIPELFGCKLDTNAHGVFLLVPARDASGELWNYQRIYNQKLSAGDKFFLYGARINGLFHTFGTLSEERTIYIAEGFATAASIFQALNREQPVVSAFNAGNILPVALAIRAKYPRAQFVFCADDDHAVRNSEGNPWNPGLEYAYGARDKLGGSVVSPVFKERGQQTDFNDLHVSEGLDVVKAQLQSPSSGVTPPAVGGFTEKKVALAMLETCGDDLVRQDKSLFRFVQTHWVELNSYDIDQLKNKINALCGDKLDNKKNNSIYNTFFRYVPHVPEGINLFAPNQKCGNFLDGTLHLSLNAQTGVYTLFFREHERTDYLTWVIPVKYKCDRELRNKLFDDLIAQALEGEEDAAGILRALKQMAGAMLVPTFSQMFFLYGISGSRKSTIALSLAKLVDSTNISHCDPANMENHQIEGLIGKLVNMHTDIDDHAPMPRGFLKRFEDDTPVQVNRKGKTVVDCMLPRVHVYCANNLPPNFEGQGKAFLRRNTLINFKRDLTHAEDGRQLDQVKKHYENIIWAAGYEGLLNFALEGLTDLVNSGGKFFQPMSSIHGIQKWQTEKDPVTQFLKSVEDGEVSDKQTQVRVGETWRIKPADLWEVFCNWHKIVFRFEPRLSRFKFYSGIMGAGVKKVTIRGSEHYAGIGVFEVETSVF